MPTDNTHCYAVRCTGEWIRHMGNDSHFKFLFTGLQRSTFCLFCQRRDKRPPLTEHFPFRKQWVSAANLTAIKYVYLEAMLRLNYCSKNVILKDS